MEEVKGGLECENSFLNGRHAVSFSAHPFSLLYRTIPVYLSVKVNVGCNNNNNNEFYLKVPF